MATLMCSRYEDGRSAILLLQKRREDFEDDFEADVYCSEAWGRRHAVHAAACKCDTEHCVLCEYMRRHAMGSRRKVARGRRQTGLHHGGWGWVPPDASLAVTSATSSCDAWAMACADSVRNAPCAVHRKPAPQPPMTEPVMAAM